MKKTIVFLLLVFISNSFFNKTSAQISLGITISAHVAPPPLPVYTQPLIPGDGYIWVPGYWAFDDLDGYYWVPGVWVRPPQFGLYWTPAYWGFDGGVYGFHPGYWGHHVGFYGGINYGFGYNGFGFGGGVWSGNVFRYNTAVSNVNTTIVHNTYVNKTVINNTTVVNKYSFNGPGGVQAKPTQQEQNAMQERHIQPTEQQMNHQQNASKNRNQFASVNHGKPTNVVMNRVHGDVFNQQGKPIGASSISNNSAAQVHNPENASPDAQKEVMGKKAYAPDKEARDNYEAQRMTNRQTMQNKPAEVHVQNHSPAFPRSAPTYGRGAGGNQRKHR